MKPGRPDLTLHDAMELILKQCEDQTAEQVYLAREINRHRLYWRIDGDPVKSGQIGARAKNYPHKFAKIPADRQKGERAKVRLL